MKVEGKLRKKGGKRKDGRIEREKRKAKRKKKNTAYEFGCIVFV